jgi:hypothetical protein
MMLHIIELAGLLALTAACHHWPETMARIFAVVFASVVCGAVFLVWLMIRAALA